MTGYLLLTNGDASFARSGPLAMTRAADRRKRVSGNALKISTQSIGSPTSRPRCGKGPDRGTRELWVGPRVSQTGTFQNARKRESAQRAQNPTGAEQTGRLTAGDEASRLQAIEDAIVV